MAQKLKFGAGQWATKEGSTLAYNDENSNFKPLPFTTTRASGATRVNKEGLIEVVGNGIPRIDYLDSADGALLLEPQRSNLITYSESFSNWSKENLTLTPNAAISPDGTLSASKINENGTNTYHALSIITNISTGNYTVSVFAKKDERRYLILRSNLSGSNVNTTFDLENGAVTYDGHTSSSIESFSNEWYRCAITSSTSATSFSTAFLMSEINVTDNTLITYQGDGTSGIYIYGAQLEEGSFPTSYIPTSGATVTRLADTASGAGNSEVFNDSEGVLFADWGASNSEGASKILTIKNSSTTTNRVSLYYYADNIYFDILNSSGTVSESLSVQNAKNFNKVSLQYQSGNTELWVNGFKSISNTQSISLIGLNKIDFDYGTGQYPFYGKTKEIGYYDTALTDEELEYMTSYRSLSELVTVLKLNTL